MEQLRPMALNDISYKMFMSVINNKIENHIARNRCSLDTQAGFTAGSRTEDNLLTLQYCVLSSFEQRKPLIVTAIDFTRA